MEQEARLEAKSTLSCDGVLHAKQFSPNRETPNALNSAEKIHYSESVML
jgi:hypothetical protein